MGFFLTQAGIAGVQALFALVSQFIGIFFGETNPYCLKNRVLVLVMTVVYWSGPVMVVAVSERLGYERELSDELGLRFLEESALWGIFSFVVARPVSQFFKTVFMACRFMWWQHYDPTGCKERRAENVIAAAVISAVSDGTGGLFDCDWLYNWREALKKIEVLEKAWVEHKENPERLTKSGEEGYYDALGLSFIDIPLPPVQSCTKCICCGEAATMITANNANFAQLEALATLIQRTHPLCHDCEKILPE